MRKFLKEFRVELIALLVAALGVFLLVEPFSIRLTVLRWLSQSVEWLKTAGGGALGTVIQYIQRLTISDFLGWALVIFAAVFVAWRLRVRFRKAFLWKADACPLCGSHLRRIHRRRFDRMMVLLLLPHAHRYLCSDPQCGWSGLRYGKPSEGRHHEDTEPQTAPKPS